MHSILIKTFLSLNKLSPNSGRPLWPPETLRPEEQFSDLPGIGKGDYLDMMSCLSQPVKAFFMSKTNIAAYILAGGQSRRMGLDKLFESVGSQSLLTKTIETCHNITSETYIVAKDKRKFEALPYKILIDDPIADGPLAGIITALKNCKEEYCFVTAADFYDLNPELIQNLAKIYKNEQFLGMNINNRIQPLCGIYNKSCLQVLQEAAKNCNYKMKNILENINSKFINIEISPWRNINLPEDLEDIKQAYV